MSISGYVLSRFHPRETFSSTGSPSPDSRLQRLFGIDVFDRLAGKLVIDFGCGAGTEAIEIAEKGARFVFGIDIQRDLLEQAKHNGRQIPNLRFSEVAEDRADVIISLDAFEHFGNPAAILSVMAQLLNPGGYVLAAFGPTWLHPYGGHLFSVFPWAHLLFTEQALIEWRSQFRDDGATKFSEVSGGLNQMSISRFEQLVQRSPLKMDAFTCVPIRRVRYLHNRVTRELFTSIVRCRLVHRNSS